MNHLQIAEVMDAYRLIPRLLLLLVYAFVAIYVYNLTAFFMDLIVMPGIGDWQLGAYSAFCTITITALTGLATGLTKVYMNSGRKWNGQERRDA